MDSDSAIQLPEKLREKFADLEQRLWLKETQVAICGALAALFISYGLVFLSDRFWETPPWLRLLLTFSGLGVLAWHGKRWADLWVLSKRDIRAFAKLVQRHHRRLGDRLLGIVELADEENRPDNMSPELCRAAIQQVTGEADKFDFGGAVNHKQAFQYAAVASGLFALVVIAFVATPAAGWNAFKRWIAPGASVERYTFVKVSELPESIIVPHGEEFELAVGLEYDSFWRPDSVEAQVENQPKLQSPVREGSARFAVPGQTREGVLKLRAGDARDSIRIQPEHRPIIRELNALVTLPDYLKYPGVTQNLQGASISVLEGSKVAFSGEGSRDLTRVSMRIADGPEQALEVKGAEFTAPEVNLDTAPFARFQWEDQLGMTNAAPRSLSIKPVKDFAPEVDLPELDMETAILETDVINLKAVARDDYGVKDVGVAWDILSGMSETNEIAAEDREFSFESGLHTETDLAETFLFSPSVMGVPTETLIEVRARARDYLPGRLHSESMGYRFYVIGLVKHAEWLRQNLDGLFARLEEVTRTEESVVEGIKDLKYLPEEEMKNDESTAAAGEKADEQAQNTAELEQIAREGARTLKEPMKNPTFDEETIKEWAKLLQEMMKLAQQEMGEATQSMRDAEASPEQREQNLEKALEKAKEALEKLAQMQDKMDEGLNELEAQTLAQRLRDVAKRERRIEARIVKIVPETIGLPADKLSPKFKEATIDMSEDQGEMRVTVETLRGEISRFFERTRRENYGEVAKEMEEQEVELELDAIKDLIAANISMQAIEELEDWSVRFEEWAKRIEPEPNPPQEGGEGSPPSLDELMNMLVTMIRLRADQDNLRLRTKMTDEKKLEGAEKMQAARELSETQKALQARLEAAREANKTEQLDPLFGEAAFSMFQVTSQLSLGDTGKSTGTALTETVNVLTDMINIINEQSQQASQQQAQGGQEAQEQMEFIMEMAEQQPGEQPSMTAGMMPGTGLNGGDQTAPNGTQDGAGLGKGATARKLGRTTGQSREVPSEFRDALESFFKGVEGGGQ